MKKFKYLEDVATADIAFMAEGKTLEEMFSNAALATTQAMVEVEKVNPTVERFFELESDDDEQLLYDFLSEIVFFKDSENLIFSKFQVNIDGGKLSATIFGEEFNEDMGYKVDVKAITMHMLKIEKYLNDKEEGFRCTVVLDI